MKGYEFAAAVGHRQDESVVRKDFFAAKPVGNIRYGQYYMFLKGVTKWLYIDYNDIVWAYRRLEDVQSRLGRKTAGLELHSLMIVTKEKKRIGISVESEENAVEGLHRIQQHNVFVDIGFAKEKEGKYLGPGTDRR